jgi:hypothetical protein
VQGHDFGGIGGNDIDGGAGFEEEAGGFGLSEEAGEVKGGETVFRIRVDGGGVAYAFFKAIETAERGGFKNIERLLFAGDRVREVAAAMIEGLHEQAHSVWVAGFGDGGVLLEKLAEDIGVAGF